jgi:energy-coupling factor transport system substrate-specific component
MRSAILGEMFSKRGLQVALVTAVIYSLLLIPFKQFVLVDTITEVRPANIVPVIMAILFGPGAALGAAAGNLVGDLFGTLTWGSIGGLIGNFAFALVAWYVWSSLAAKLAGRFDVRAASNYLASAVAASLACAAIIAIALQLTGLAPLLDMFALIALNNIAWTCTLGLVAFWLLYGRVGNPRSEKTSP